MKTKQNEKNPTQHKFQNAQSIQNHNSSGNLRSSSSSTRRRVNAVCCRRGIDFFFFPGVKVKPGARLRTVTFWAKISPPGLARGLPHAWPRPGFPGAPSAWGERGGIGDPGPARSGSGAGPGPSGSGRCCRPAGSLPGAGFV